MDTIQQNSFSSENMEKILDVIDVHKYFQHGKNLIKVLKGINLTVYKKEMIAIVGASGAGKSTLLHIIGTLDVPTKGNVLFNNLDLFKFSEKKLARFRNRSLGFVFQFHHLLPEFNALENVMLPGLIQAMPKKEIEEKAKKILDEVELSHRLNHKPGELSGGEQQRVALARALVLEPAILLADEPTGNLDSKMSKEIHDLFWKINKNHETTMIIVTHNKQLADMMPRVVEMVDGIIEEQNVEQQNS